MFILFVYSLEDNTGRSQRILLQLWDTAGKLDEIYTEQTIFNLKGFNFREYTALFL